jgi:hypothetical protein
VLLLWMVLPCLCLFLCPLMYPSYPSLKWLECFLGTLLALALHAEPLSWWPCWWGAGMQCTDEPSDGDIVEGQAYFSNSEQVICHTFSTKSAFNQGCLMATMNTTIESSL